MLVSNKNKIYISFLQDTYEYCYIRIKIQTELELYHNNEVNN